jgi:hypothetical protein
MTFQRRKFWLEIKHSMTQISLIGYLRAHRKRRLSTDFQNGTPSLKLGTTKITFLTRVSTHAWGKNACPNGTTQLLTGLQECQDQRCTLARLCWTISTVRRDKRLKRVVNSKCQTIALEMFWRSLCSLVFLRVNLIHSAVSSTVKSNLTTYDRHSNCIPL